MAEVLQDLKTTLEVLLLEKLVAAKAKATVSRTLIVDRDYEPSRVARKAMASSYEVLIPTRKLSRNRRQAAVANEPVRDLGQMLAAGGPR